MLAANWRLFLILPIMLALAPVIWIRSELPPPDLAAPVIFTRLAMPQPAPGEVRLLGGWKLASTNDHFGGYSALLAIDGGHLVAASDRGRIMRLELRGDGPPTAQMGYLSANAGPEKRLIDVESMTRDPATGHIWIGYEGVNAIERRDSGFRQPVRVRPAQMRDWSVNKGAEAVGRLADGRFIVLAEQSGAVGGGPSAALLFPSDPVGADPVGADPVGGAAAAEFRFAPPEGYRPVDMVQIPDGRVLILVRRFHWEIMPRFTAKLVLADPAEIVPGGTWSGRIIAEFAPPVPTDNFEGLAMRPRQDGQLDLWMISDDNRAGFQNTYLLEMRWDPRPSAAAGRQAKEKARSTGRTP